VAAAQSRPHAAVGEESAAEKRALDVVALTFFLLAIYITWEALNSLIGREEPLTSPVGIILAVLSLAVMPTLASPSSGSARRWEAAL
jgi:divalent metal cation (Fe/Co/Zn/Cd) transporter